MKKRFLTRTILGLALAGMLLSPFTALADDADESTVYEETEDTTEEDELPSIDEESLEFPTATQEYESGVDFGYNFNSDDTSFPKTGYITITYSCDGVFLDGVRVSVTKIADVTIKDKAVVYHLCEELSKYSKTDKFGKEMLFDGLTAKDSLDLATKFATEKLPEGKIKTTNSDGQIFITLEKGMYLIKQEGKRGVSANYYDFEPYLLSVPTIVEGQYAFDIECKPKTTTKIIPTTAPTEKQTTPDTPSDHTLGIEGFAENHLGQILIIGGVLVLFLAIVLTGIAFYERKE